MSNVAGQLRSYVERIERLDEEIKALNTDKRDIYAEAKANGFDAKALRHVIRLRGQDAADRQEFEAIVELYMQALGMLPADEPRVHVHAREAANTPPPAIPPSDHDGSEGKHASEREAQKADVSTPASVGGGGERPKVTDLNSEEAVGAAGEPPKIASTNSPPLEMPDIPPAFDRRGERAGA